MVTQPKISVQTDTKPYMDVLMVIAGMALGGLITLASLWLWLDYRAHPTNSLLAGLSYSLVTAIPAPLETWLSQEAHLMGLPLTGQTSAYWYMARAGGIVAYLLLWLSVGWGLVISTKITDGRVPAPFAFGLHEFLSIGAILFAALHSLVLLGDSYINFNIFHLVIPFIAPYRPAWTGLGTVGFYLSAALTGSFYLRKQIGQKTWRKLHYFTFAAYVLVLLHGFMAGTDSSLGGIRLMYLLTGSGILFLTYYRLFTLKVKNPKGV